MRNRLILLITFGVLLSATLVTAAQATEYKPSPHVYRIRSGDCVQDPTDRVQTGFRVKNVVGIITALHGVADCTSITATAVTTSQSGDKVRVFQHLIIGKVDFNRDTALLWSKELEGETQTGLSTQSAARLPVNTSLQAIGYPQGVNDQNSTPNLHYLQTNKLLRLLPDQAYEYVLSRSSPAPNINALSIQGFLQPGHSGAPLTDDSLQVIGIANGGLKRGLVGLGWAIPLEDLQWKVVSNKVSSQVSQTDVDALNKLARIRLDFGFSIATPEDYSPLQPLLPIPQRWVDNRANASFVKIDAGPFEFGSTLVEANTALETCYHYSGNLCLWEAFVDEIVADKSRGIGDLAEFWIMETEVSNAQYDICINAGGCRQPDKNIRPSGPPDHPVRLSDVQYAIEYANWACGRLPTELEWEKAARGPHGLTYPWGTTWELGRANSCGAECVKKPLTTIQPPSDGFTEAAPVYTLEAGRSPYGLYHMAGNVREWAVRDQRRPFSQDYTYMLKGGSFFDFPEVLRAADRLRRPNDNRYPDVITAGFRIVRDTVGNQCR